MLYFVLYERHQGIKTSIINVRHLYFLTKDKELRSRYVYFITNLFFYKCNLYFNSWYLVIQGKVLVLLSFYRHIYLTFDRFDNRSQFTRLSLLQCIFTAFRNSIDNWLLKNNFLSYCTVNNETQNKKLGKLVKQSKKMSIVKFGLEFFCDSRFSFFNGLSGTTAYCLLQSTCCS